MAEVCAIVLAAGAGSRFGGPKALARRADGVPWIALTVDALREGGCARVVVVLGAAAESAAALVPCGAETVVADGWAGGVSQSLLAGIRAVTGPDGRALGALEEVDAHGPDALLVVPVDTPDLPAAAVARVIAAAGDDTRRALVRAVYGSRPGHPVLIGAAHLPGLIPTLTGDVGAGPYLSRRDVLRVECGDLWSGDDIDRRAPR